MCTWFHRWGSESWLPSLVAEQNRPMGPGVPPPSASCPLAYKSHGPWGTLGLPRAKTFRTRPYSSVLGKEHSCVASDKEGLGSPWQTSLDPPCCISFSCCFRSVSFAVINLSIDYYLLSSPSRESPNETLTVSFLSTSSVVKPHQHLLPSPGRTYSQWKPQSKFY